jgi:transglutaminase-like putative cysteine protease
VEQEAMHAWAEAHVDGLGWVGFDPYRTASRPDVKYVRVATGLDYTEAAPVTGPAQVGGAGETLAVAIDVAQQ